ncbi:MAG: hypothetical protein GY807_24610 [Gammaproteobacteria bacterium]|nr:hypothetical protein [Gammaproteobacteria bacterium]
MGPFSAEDPNASLPVGLLSVFGTAGTGMYSRLSHRAYPQPAREEITYSP